MCDRSDRALVRECINGDPDAFPALMERYCRQVHAIAYGVLLRDYLNHGVVTSSHAKHGSR